jgi:predicted amidohydrolase
MFGNVDHNISQAIGLMQAVEADLYVLPELFNTGYNFINEKEVHDLAEPPTGKTFQAIAEFASGNKRYVVFGFAEKADLLYNSAAIVGPNGLIGLYRKIHLFYRETLFFAPGNLGFPVFELPFGKVGIMICFDWFFPESARTLALQGADIITHPSNLVMPYCPDAMVTRCLENRIFCATANRIGSEDRGGNALTYIGTSEIVSPRGEILKRLRQDESAVASADVDLSQARDKSLNIYNNIVQDRKPGSYNAF